MSDDLLFRLRRAGPLLDANSPAADPEVLVGPEPLRRRTFQPLAIVAAVLLLLGAVALTANRPAPPPTMTTQLGASSDAVSEVPAVARLLPSEGGWRIVEVTQMSASRGEVTFSGHGRSATLTWSPVGAVPEPQPNLQQLDVGGFRALVGSYGDGAHVATWEHAGVRAALVGDGTADQFARLLEALRQVDGNAWTDALLASAR